jgi:hypothetical protein
MMVTACASTCCGLAEKKFQFDSVGRRTLYSAGHEGQPGGWADPAPGGHNAS